MIELRNGSGAEEREPMELGKRIRHVIIQRINLANPIHWRDFRHLREIVDRSSDTDGLPMRVRDAVPEDAPAACEVMRRSITELCGADHGNDPVVLGR